MASASRKKVRVTPPTGTSAAAAVAAPAPNVTVGDADVLECGVCLLPLRPPIFQCEVGHVVCSVCRDKMEATGKSNCHVCGVATRGYRRCHAMEQLVDCTRVACPYAAHGCDATPPYHGRESHRQVCPHAPCHCPGQSCGFIGSVAALLDHFASAHDWPCTTVRAAATAKSFVWLRDGFNFFRVADHDHGSGDGEAAANCSVPCLFLLNVTLESLGRAISVLCIHPHANGDGDGEPMSMQCDVRGGSLCRRHNQTSEFQVGCTDLSNGLPSLDACFYFIVPYFLLEENDCILVAASWAFNHSRLRRFQFEFIIEDYDDIEKD